jgi:hypothetical protein
LLIEFQLVGPDQRRATDERHQRFPLMLMAVELLGGQHHGHRHTSPVGSTSALQA